MVVFLWVFCKLPRLLLNGDFRSLVVEVDGRGLHLGHDVLHHLLAALEAVFGFECEEVAAHESAVLIVAEEVGDDSLSHCRYFVDAALLPSSRLTANTLLHVKLRYGWEVVV